MNTIYDRWIAHALRAGRASASWPRVRWARISVMLCAFFLVACASAPPNAAPAAPMASTPQNHVQVHGSDGPKTPQAGAAELRSVGAEGRDQQFEQHVAILEKLGETFFAGNDATLLVDGPKTFDAMLKELEGAKRRILFESYIFDNQDIGRRMADVLLRKRAEGLEVRLIYDSVGSFETPVEFFDSLRDGGVAVCEFNPVSPLRRATGFLKFNNRDHRKVLLVDDVAAFTGGINVSRVYSSGSIGSRQRPASGDNEKGWRDTHVRIAGPALREFIAMYEDTWHRQNCDDQLSPLSSEVKEERPAPELGDRLVVVIGSVADEGPSRFHAALLNAIDGATDSVHITMAYFVPDDHTLAALTGAARRGVDVRLVLPGRTDSKLVLRAGQANYLDLLQAGVRIFERHDTILHAKTAVIDGVWTTIGSSNLDLRSMLHNDELNVIILGRDFSAVMEGLFRSDVEDAVEIELEAWKARGIGRRLMETLGRMWEYWL